MVTCGFYLALWARLIDIGIRTTFCTFALMCTRFCEELSERMEEIVERQEVTNRDYRNEKLGDEIGEFARYEKIAKNREELQKWKEDYESINNLIESLSFSFGLVLFLFACHDFAIGILKFADILECDDKVESAFLFVHHLCRVLILLIASNQVNLKVKICFFSIT